MSIREQQPEVEPERAPELDAALAASDSTLRQLDVAKGREKHLREQVDKLEGRLLEKEKELSASPARVSRPLRDRGVPPAHAKLESDEAPPGRQATARALVTTTLCFVGARRGNAFMNGSSRRSPTRSRRRVCRWISRSTSFPRATPASTS